MTDKTVPPLNLIERMAQRLEKEAANQAPAANAAGRAMDREPLDNSPMLKNGGAPSVNLREPIAPSIPQPPQGGAPRRGDGVSAIGPAANAYTSIPSVGRMPELGPIPNPQVEGRWRRVGDTRASGLLVAASRPDQTEFPIGLTLHSIPPAASLRTIGTTRRRTRDSSRIISRSSSPRTISPRSTR